ncbi:MAG TPA: CDP-glycerol glycerophosphotransferase family protein, partial [Thermoleophilaceae bacterium]|nr:CDP-glycerol glycerophosphotransferase family protein [Thermoleophilaceae bacterium]
IYNVEEYLEPCLESVARQTVQDLEVIMVDDGSTDRSGEIAAAFAERDPRFKLVTKENGGLSSARNAGAEHASGEFLAFLDSDDLLPLGALEMLVTPLQETGSDFATGNVSRITAAGVTPTRFLAKAFEQDRLRTHITKFRPLLADRIAPNKLWRRSFWESNGFRFPEGMLHEDIPVVLPAHFAAKSVDVISEPVYLYRVREGTDLSITQRRLEKRALLDRVKAVQHVSDHLAEKGARRTKRWYDESVIEADLSYYLNVLDNADDEYRSLFLEHVNAFLDRAGRGLFDDLHAIDRLKWHLVRRRLMPELVQVLRFQKETMRETPPVKVGRRWYGDYPFRTDRRVGIPRSVYRLDEELALSPRVGDLRFDGDELKVRGYAFIAGIGAAEPASQRVTVTVLRRGRLRALRMRTTAIRLRAAVQHRPEVTSSTSQSSADVQWSGFEATLPPRRLRSLFSRRRTGTWDLYVTVRAGGVTRRRSRFLVDGPRPIRAVERVLGDGVRVKASPAPGGELAVQLDERWAAATGHRLAEGFLELTGDLRGYGPQAAALRLTRVGSTKIELPISLSGDSFSVRVPFADLERTVAAADPEPHGGEHGEGMVWNVWIVAGGDRRRLALDAGVREGSWPCAGRELVLLRTGDGDAALVAREPQPCIEEARWTESGELEVAGTLPDGASLHELVVLGRAHLERHSFPASAGGARFAATLTPARVPSLAGELPLQEGNWDIHARAEPGAPLVRVMLAQALDPQLPLKTVVGNRTLMLGVTPEQNARFVIHRDLDDETERGRFHQRRLRETVYAPARTGPLRDAVVYASFRGWQYSDTPRLIHEELVRRGAPLEHLWLVRDGRCAVPPTATVLRSGSRDHYEAMASARFVVVNEYLPQWFERRPDQVVIQALHGTPLKRVALDVPHLRSTMRRSWRWAEQIANWQYVLSPNAFSTPILHDAFGIEGEMVETGLPRNDLLARPELDAQVRDRLGVPAGARVILYAPTYRDHVVDRRGRYRLDHHIDLERLGEAAGPDAFVLFRKHPFVEELMPEEEGSGRVRDVSEYPDVTELLAAADVLVTDYSSLMFDFAVLGRPMIFFAYDLDHYERDIRGFYIDFRAEAPGPIVGSEDELADALRSLGGGGVPSAYAERYAAWRAKYCGLDDGGASARVVDRFF